MKSSLFTVVYDMKYSDEAGHLWRNLAEVADDTAALLNQQGVKTILAYPRITGQRPYPLHHCEVAEISLIKGGASRSEVTSFIQKHHIKALLYQSVQASDVDITYLQSLGVKCICVERLSFSENHLIKFFARIKRVVKKCLPREKYDFYIANSEYQKNYIKSFTDIPMDKVTTITNGVNTEHFKPDAAREAAASLDLPIAQLKVGIACQCRPEKRIDWLVDVASQLKAARPNLDFCFAHAGAGGAFDMLNQYVVDKQAEAYFKFIGYLKDPVALYGWCDIFVHAAERESFGTVLIEAMSSGCPVIASRAGGPSIIIEDGKTGLLIDKNDQSGFVQALLQLADDPTRRKQMGQSSRERVIKLFSREKQAQAFCDVISELICT